ncbi:hypothetical protein DOY81_008003 [Sarcophaga bullata]|nr:hypothetical protein DOY81_008003 [Sarcophaga bullata]
MKVIVFLLVATLSLSAINANAVDNTLLNSEDIQEYEYAMRDLPDIDPIGGIFTIVKAVVRTLKGVSCAVDEVLAIKMAANEFLAATTACGGEINKDVQNLIDAVYNIVVIAEDVADVGINDCLKGVGGGSVISGVVTGPKCALKMSRRLTKFSKEVLSTLKLIVQIKDVPGDTGKCALDAITTLGGYFTEFVPNIKSCSEMPNSK